MTEDWATDEDTEFECGNAEISEEEQMFEEMLEIVTGKIFTDELNAFGEKHANKFPEICLTDECTHEQYEIFREYRKLIEAVIDREMTEALGRPFSCAGVASKFSEKPDLAVFEEVADVLNSLNDFVAFKAEMIAHTASKDKQDIFVETVKISSKKPLSRSEQIRNCN
jgi:hypothetical protein